MTDFKADIKIKFDFMGKVETYDGYINYSDRGDGLDERIAEWFCAKYEAGIRRYQDRLDEVTRAQREHDLERSERSELERLTAKYAVKAFTKSWAAKSDSSEDD